jgi:hypothetical protein
MIGSSGIRSTCVDWVSSCNNESVITFSDVCEDSSSGTSEGTILSGIGRVEVCIQMYCSSAFWIRLSEKRSPLITKSPIKERIKKSLSIHTGIDAIANDRAHAKVLRRENIKIRG